LTHATTVKVCVPAIVAQTLGTTVYAYGSIAGAGVAVVEPLPDDQLQSGGP
jgi:hypothetical protein